MCLGLDGLGKGLQTLVDQLARVHLAPSLSLSSDFAASRLLVSITSAKATDADDLNAHSFLQSVLPILPRPQDKNRTGDRECTAR